VQKTEIAAEQAACQLLRRVHESRRAPDAEPLDDRLSVVGREIREERRHFVVGRHLDLGEELLLEARRKFDERGLAADASLLPVPAREPREVFEAPTLSDAADAKAAYFENGELPRLFAALAERGSVYRVLFEVALKTGMRQGQLLALTWGDVDLVHSVIHVRRTFTNGNLGAPKNHEKREVFITNEVVEMLGS
jgi:integrase